MTKRKTPFSFQIRIIHRYLGFFLAGIMFVYALSGIIMVYRNTDFLKTEVITEKKLAPNLSERDLAPIFKKGAKVIKQEGAVLYLRNGNYNQTTGVATIKKMQLPFVLDKMEKLHKANTSSPLYFLNIFFGVALLFFVFSAFWMYAPKMPVFKKGMYFAVGGVLLTIILLFI
ncbi:PepSY domain-containing protein [Polaribacter sp. NJDZ03]|uniref:PepSY domain-containing protein n=1 Tax=Polaribacter sp. NJDZ03 TaxID=2855841 RepID=UPI001C49FC78|nr:PepSY domain-containing protein [Polaribacter sp. NJDZ03]